MFSLTFLIDRTGSHRKRDICSLQIYHNTSSNAIWRSHEGWYLDRAINYSNHSKSEFPCKLTPTVAATCLILPLVLLVEILVSGICIYMLDFIIGRSILFITACNLCNRGYAKI